MNETGISWTQLTWNPVSGCRKISPGCAFCYAHSIAEPKRGSPAFPNGFDLTLRPHKLSEPGKLKQPALIFVNSMSDLWWEEIPLDYYDKIIDAIEQTPWHQYQCLTKRPEYMLEQSRRRPLPANIWAGVSVENQDYVHRIDVLKQVEARIRFVSAEPLLGPLALDLTGIHWLITGGESGNQTTDLTINAKRSMVEPIRAATVRERSAPGPRWIPKPEAVRIVRDIMAQCRQYGTAFYHKQWGGPKDVSGGDLLDGVQYHEWPKEAPRPWGKAEPVPMPAKQPSKIMRERGLF